MQQKQFECFYEEYSDAIFKYILMLVGNKETAEDFTQETFYRAYKQYETFKEQASIQTWLRKIARNLVYDHYRRKRIIQFIPFLSQHEQQDTNLLPSEIVEKGEAIVAVYRALSKLKLEYKEVIILRKIEGLSIKETGNLLGWTEVKVKNATARAMQALKKELEEGGELHGEGFRSIIK